jgi:M6 family metalloprotease-like protein
MDGFAAKNDEPLLLMGEMLMANSRILASGLHGGIGAQFDPSSNRIFFVEFGGTISSAALDGSTHTVLGSGYFEPEGIVVSGDGATAFVTERAGTLLRVSVAAPNRTSATVVAAGLLAPQQMVLFERANLAWVVEFNTLGRLIEIDLLTGNQTVLASGLQHAVGLEALADRSAAFVTEQAGSGGRIIRIDLHTATRTTLADGLTAPFFLTWTDTSQTELLFTERDPANRISILDLRTTPASRRLAVLDVPLRPSSVVQVGRELIVCSDQSLVAYDITAGLPSAIRISTPARPLYVGSYRRVVVDLGISGIGFDDLDFTVPGGRAAGLISPSRDATFNLAHPEIMLLAGYRPGHYLIHATHRPTGAIVGEAKFALTNDYHDDQRGPSKWFNGILPAYSASPTWGGGATGSPQNFNTVPALGTKRVAVLFVDTSDQRYTTVPATLATFRSRWQQHVADGVTGADGVARSVARYYREVSYNSIGLGGMDVAATIFPDVVHLPNDWTTYFQLDVNNLWQAKNEFINQCVTAAGDGVNLTGFDMIVCVSQAAGGTAPIKVAWPYGGYGVSVDSAHGRVTGRGISMPNEWGDGTASDQGKGRTIFETLTHEMGHTINLPDEYKPPVAGRLLAGNPVGASSWDPMEAEQNLPDFVLPHRMMLGWIQAPWIKLYNFLLSPGTLVDETITLAAIEVVPPPVNQFSGIEIRIGDGRNYYAEYRRGQAMQIGDELLTPNARVVLTDVSEPPDPPVIARPDILLLPKHTDDDGAVLNTAQFYHETDNTTPTFPSDFRLDVVSFNGNQAVVRVRYGVIGKPDPSIRPWPRDAAHQWQSPDIEVNNARNAVDSAWANVPWRGHDNTVVARITNRGSLSAPGVVANFFVKDYTIGGAPETLLGSDEHDVAPGATVAFSTNWSVPAPPNDADAQHFCIILRIDSYQTPTTPPVHELTDANNVAQSNYDRFISATSTPSREIAAVTAGNPYPKTTRFFVGAGQSNPLYRTFVEHTWLRLKPGEQTKIRVMFEFAPDAPQSDPEVGKLKERFLRLPNVVNMVGMIEDPGDARLHGPDLATGVTAVVVTGKSTRIVELRSFGERVSGQVFTKDAGPVPAGAVIVTTRDKNHKTQSSVTGKVGANGAFALALKPGWATLEAYYAGAPGYADCEAHIAGQ